MKPGRSHHLHERADITNEIGSKKTTEYRYAEGAPQARVYSRVMTGDAQGPPCALAISNRDYSRTILGLYREACPLCDCRSLACCARCFWIWISIQFDPVFVSHVSVLMSGCCLTSLLNRIHKFQQVRVDFILVRSSEAVRPPWIVNFLRPLDEPGRFLRRIFDGARSGHPHHA